MGSTVDAAASVRGATEYAERQYAYMSPGERYERVRRTRAGNARDLLGDIGATLADGTDQDVVGGEDVPTGGQLLTVSTLWSRRTDIAVFAATTSTGASSGDVDFAHW